MQNTQYRTLDATGLREYLVSHSGMSRRLGGPADTWSVQEVSDGNLNMVWLVHGPDGALCAKQSLPHVRVDPSWKMPTERTFFEAAWLREISQIAGNGIPELLHFDPDLFLLVMQCLDHHTTLNIALSDMTYDPSEAVSAIARFVARTAWSTSCLSETFEENYGVSSVKEDDD
ncbi:hypothetical protein LOC54_01530 [Acetobacter sp. AN02]|uniref:hypothetical protein n=1 Tax=Acetobacter sp. AN02 TaxID=2894186 RepID=UPI002434118B|nr:hypothetical protein [Acetobacter sp. AN02]MDG6093803.1 hypothetical protein [Acetobacter sp. AN02]